MAKIPSQKTIEATEDFLDPYFMALGRVAHSWNHLHEELGKLFCAVGGLELGPGMAIWHALKSDRSQRDILTASLNQRAENEDWIKHHPGAKDGIIELLKRANSLAERRNTAIHAPCNVAIDGAEFQIVPITFFRNDKAKKLTGKDILKEFRWYEQCAETFKRYAIDCRYALDAGLSMWPDMPPTPTLG